MNWLICQINCIANYICQSPGEPDLHRELADEFRKAAERIDAYADKRERCRRDYEGMFG
jgi:hypothetical protein